MGKNYRVIEFSLFVIAFLSTIVTLFIVYKDINNSFSTPYIMGYLIFLLFYVIYIFTASIWNARKLNWKEMKKRTVKAWTLFLLFSFTTYIGIYFFHSAKNHSYGFLMTALGMALGLSFLDLAFHRGKKP